MGQASMFPEMMSAIGRSMWRWAARERLGENPSIAPIKAD
jgi:hypothetical protein